MPERDRPGVVADGAQPERQLAEGLAAGERLQRGRQPRRAPRPSTTSDGHRGERVVGGRRPPPTRAATTRTSSSALAQHVDQAGGHPDRDGRRRQVEGDRLAGDEVVVPHERRARPTVQAIQRGRGTAATVSAWTSTPSWPRTARRWRRLEELSRRRRLSGAEADELVDGYQEVATHLSVVRSSAPDPALVAYLSSAARPGPHRVRPAPARRSLARRRRGSSTATFPAALYRTRRWWLATLAVNVAVAAVMMPWLLEHPGVESSLLSPAEADRLVNVDFERYYSEYAASHFAAQVWTNNAWVAALCIALGVLGLPVVYLLFSNIAQRRGDRRADDPARPRLAVLRADPAARPARADRGLRRRRGRAAAVLVVGRAGRRGPARSRWRTRAAAPAAVALGLVLVLLVSGVIEAFVTPSGLPTWARIGDRRGRRGGCSSPTSSCVGRARAFRGRRTPVRPRRTDRLEDRGRDRPTEPGRLEQPAALQHQVVVGQRDRQPVGVGVHDVDARVPPSTSAVRARSASTCSAAAASYTAVGVAARGRPSARAPGRAPRPAPPGAGGRGPAARAAGRARRRPGRGRSAAPRAPAAGRARRPLR